MVGLSQWMMVYCSFLRGNLFTWVSQVFPKFPWLCMLNKQRKSAKVCTVPFLSSTFLCCQTNRKSENGCFEQKGAQKARLSSFYITHPVCIIYNHIMLYESYITIPPHISILEIFDSKTATKPHKMNFFEK